MPTLLVRHATLLVTMDGARREIARGGLFARDGWVEQVGPDDALPEEADEVIDLPGHLSFQAWSTPTTTCIRR